MILPPRHYQLLYLLGVGLVLTIVAARAMPTVTGRHFQVDEFQNSYNCRLLAQPETRDKAFYVLPYMTVLGRLTAGFEETTAMLLAFRGVFFVVFLANLVLAAHAQRAFPSRLGRWLVLVGFAPLYPLWLYGLEIRSDNLLLMGNLALFWLTQRAAARAELRPSAIFWGGVAVYWTCVSAHKGFVYALPFGALLVATHSAAPGIRAAVVKRARPAAWLLAGFTAAAAATSVLLTASGTLTATWRAAFVFAEHLGDFQGFSHWGMTRDTALRYPHLFAAGAVLLVLVAAETARRVRGLGGRGLTPDRVTATYLLWSLAVLQLNPKPYPYNLLHFLPFVFFAAVAAIARLPAPGWGRKAALAFLALANVVAAFYAAAAFPYGRADNRYQLGYIRAAETLTDPARDSVLDGVGMVLTRVPPDADWLLHGSYMNAYRRGDRSSFADLLESAASPVVITNYRWSWLGEREWSALRRRYVPLAKDFWVLGGRAPGRLGSFEIDREGRYFVLSAFRPPDRAAAASTGVTVDGRDLPTGVVHLERGSHRFTAPTEEGLVVSWAGPRLEAPLAFDSLPRGRPLLQPF